eukprot:758417-Hanusia_phi.AAC.3
MAGEKKEISLKQLALICMFIASKMFDARPVLLYDEAMSLADDEDGDMLALLSCRVLDVLYIYFSANEGLGVLANVPHPLLANAVHAAALSLVICSEVQQPHSSILYCCERHSCLLPPSPPPISRSSCLALLLLSLPPRPVTSRFSFSGGPSALLSLLDRNRPAACR